MILLDTHIWIWWVNGSSELSTPKQQILDAHAADSLGVSVISCWEVAKLVEKGRLILTVPLDQWMEKALSAPGICLLPLDPKIGSALFPVVKGRIMIGDRNDT